MDFAIMPNDTCGTDQRGCIEELIAAEFQKPQGHVQAMGGRSLSDLAEDVIINWQCIG